MKTIIVATDYSSTADNALQFGANLAHSFKADLVLFNVYNMSVHVRNSWVMPDAIDHLKANNENRLKQLAEQTAEQYQINVSWVVKTEATVGELENYLTTDQGDLIVMGMESNVAEYKLLGNTTTAAIRRMKYPLLVVPNGVEFKGIKKILYACEYTYLSHDNHLNLLKEMTRKFGAQLQVLHVETKTREHVPATVDKQIHAIDTILENTDHTYTFVDNPSVGEGIIQEVQAWQADLLVMVPHKTRPLELLLKGSDTRKMALRTRVPLLVLPNSNGMGQ